MSTKSHPATGAGALPTNFVELPGNNFTRADNVHAIVGLTDGGFGKAGVLIAADTASYQGPIKPFETAQDALAFRDQLIATVEAARGAPLPLTEHGDYVSPQLSTLSLSESGAYIDYGDGPFGRLAKKAEMVSSMVERKEPIVDPMPWQVSASFRGNNSVGMPFGNHVSVTCPNEDSARWLAGRLTAPLSDAARTMLQANNQL